MDNCCCFEDPCRHDIAREDAKMKREGRITCPDCGQWLAKGETDDEMCGDCHPERFCGGCGIPSTHVTERGFGCCDAEWCKERM